MTEIAFSKAALRDLQWLHDYGIRFGQQFVNEMADEFQQRLLRIRTEPLGYPVVKPNPEFRSCVLPPNTRIYYRYISERKLVRISRIFDQRRHPDTLGLM
jgi:plasmid stabilization system protein ParE